MPPTKPPFCWSVRPEAAAPTRKSRRLQLILLPIAIRRSLIRRLTSIEFARPMRMETLPTRTKQQLLHRVPGLPRPGPTPTSEASGSRKRDLLNGTFTVKGSGSDIWNTADAFHFVYQPRTGDGEIIAQVASVQNTDVWAKAGVMIRDTLNANSKHAMMVVTPGNGVSFQQRTSTGGTSVDTTTTGRTAPQFLRPTRVGSTFTAYYSSNGTSWTQIGSTTISMSSTAPVWSSCYRA